ncbi:MAG: response regulator [Myxococcota bacterium]
MSVILCSYTDTLKSLTETLELHAGVSGSERSTKSGAALTTGQAALLCGVDRRTVARWADAGIVPSFRTAGGRRRIARADIVAFMRKSGIPVPPEVATQDPEAPRIAVCDSNGKLTSTLPTAIRAVCPRAVVRSANDAFSAGVLVASFAPDVVFLDLIMPGLGGVDVCQNIRTWPPLRGVKIVIISEHITEGVRQQFLRAGAFTCLRHYPSESQLFDLLADCGAELPVAAEA